MVFLFGAQLSTCFNQPLVFGWLARSAHCGRLARSFPGKAPGALRREAGAVPLAALPRN